MKVALLGCGQMGRAAAYALATDPGTEELLLLDRDPGQAAALRDWLQEGGGTGNRPAATVRAATGLDAALAGCGVVAMAMPWAPTAEALHAAVVAGRPVAAITRPPTAELPSLDTRIRSAGGTVLLPVGLEPGLTELLAVHLRSGSTGSTPWRSTAGEYPPSPANPWATPPSSAARTTTTCRSPSERRWPWTGAARCTTPVLRSGDP